MSRGRVANYLLSAIVAATVGYVVTREATPSAQRPFAVNSVTLSIVSPSTWDSSFYTGTLGALNGNMVVGDDTAEGRTSTCRLAVISPESLRIESNRAVNCNSPTLQGEPVAPVESVMPVSSNTGEVRIATLVGTSGVFHVGPIVLRYGNYSDTRPEWTYGGGYLWIFDAETPSGTEVLRISESTGAVLSTVHLPWSARVLLAADDDGLWIAQGPEGGWQPGERAALMYFVGVHASRAIAVLSTPEPTKGGRVNWLVAWGHAAIADVSQPTNPAVNRIESFVSPTAQPHSVNAANSWEPTNIGEGPYDAPPIIQAPGIGLIAADPGWLGSLTTASPSESVIQIDPGTGRELDLKSFRTPSATSLEANVVYDDALYMLVSENDPVRAALYRVQL